MILLPQLNAVPVGIKIFTWNVMGSTREGWADVRKLFIKGNINGYDIVFLQEVQWVNEEHFITGNYQLAKMTESINKRGERTKRNICILIDPQKLKCEESLRTDVTRVIMTVMGWSDKYFHRVGIQVFTQQGRGETSRFVAIGVHAPIDRQDCHTFGELLKIAVEKINEVLALPVLLAGDFNCDITAWGSSTFLVPQYPAGRSPIDFIALKITSDSHLAIENMTMTQYSEVLIPDAARQLKVKVQNKQSLPMPTVDQLIQKYSQNLYTFYVQLCDGHRPLSAEVKNSNAMSPEEVARHARRVEELEDENELLKVEVARHAKREKELEDENKKLKKEVTRHAERVKELEDENEMLKKKVDRLASQLKS